MASACRGSVMSPTAMVTMPVARRISRANGTWMPGLATIFCAGETPPLDVSIQSQPRASRRRASSTDSASVQPPSTQSCALMRTPSGRLAGPRRAHRVEHLQRKPDPVLEGAAVGIVAAIGDRRQELVQQVAMRHVQLDGVDADPLRAPRGVDEGVAHAGESRGVQRVGRALAFGVRDRRRRERSSSRPRAIGISVPPSQGRRDEPLRPACASWIATGIGGACRRARASVSPSALSVASSHRPRHPWRDAPLRR